MVPQSKIGLLLKTREAVLVTLEYVQSGPDLGAQRPCQRVVRFYTSSGEVFLRVRFLSAVSVSVRGVVSEGLGTLRLEVGEPGPSFSSVTLLPLILAGLSATGRVVWSFWSDSGGDERVASGLGSG